MQTLASTLAGPLRCMPLPSIAKQYTPGENITVCTVRIDYMAIHCTISWELRPLRSDGTEQQ